MRGTNRTVHSTTTTLFSVVLSIALTTQVRSQQALDYRAVDAIERETVALLLKEDLRKVVDQLSAERPTTVAPLLRQLILYSRAGRPEGVRQTLKQFETVSDWQSGGQSQDVRIRLRQSIGEDLEMWRYYYERLYPHDSDGAEAFVRLWDRDGDARELDSWLAVHSTGEDEWFRVRLYRRAKLGTAAELLEPLVAAVRANPHDLGLIMRYLRANNAGENLQDVSWLGDVCELTGAYENFELGQWLGHTQGAARLLEKSLALPVTERDTRLVQVSRAPSIVPAGIDWAKQLRFWTKQLLAECYRALNRPQDAQHLIEELVAMKGKDILDQDVHQLAGSVQAQSGQRVVETQILRNEVTQRQTSQYWLERANYYDGRSEYELEKETYLKALAALPGPNNQQRLEVVRSFSFFIARNRKEQPRWQAELEGILRREFNSVRPKSDYAFWLARIITNNELELDALRHSLYVAQPNLVARLLGARAEWGNEETYLIEEILRGDEITAAEKDALWTALEKLVTDPGSMRAYQLAEAMVYHGASERALALWVGFLNNAPSFDYVDRNELLVRVVDGYCKKGKWQAAERLLFNNTSWCWASLPRNLGVIAAAAAQHGAPSDALRLWRLKANLDRRDLTGLDQLSRTEAKSQLREFYLKMKKDDPQTTVAESALRTLQ